MPSVSTDSSFHVALASTFYTPALEAPVRAALTRMSIAAPVDMVPYNQLHTFLLEPQGQLPAHSSSKVFLLIRAEDLIRTELSAGVADQPDRCAQIFQERLEEFLQILSAVSRVRLGVLICPSGRGAHRLDFLSNQLRVAEHKIAALLRRQQRHLVMTWPEFEREAQPQNPFNPAADRLGHVPFSPAGLDSIAGFLASHLDRVPSSEPRAETETASALDLERFLAGLEVHVSFSPLNDEDEAAAVTLVRHTTHFVNCPGRKWDAGDIRTLERQEKNGEAWGVRVRDRFGNYGVSGAVTYGVQGDVMRIGLLFLTCPVLGRQVEYALFGWLADVARQRGASSIVVPFTPGRDNAVLESVLGKFSGSGATADSVRSARDFRLPVVTLLENSLRLAPHSPSVSRMLNEIREQSAGVLASATHS